MAKKTEILQVFKPEIKLEEMSVEDFESPDHNSASRDKKPIVSKTAGYFAPFIMINGYKFDHRNIFSVRFSEDGFMPTIRVRLYDSHGIFKSAYFPKSNPILSLYIRSAANELKCIRCDFLITDVNTRSMDRYPEDAIAGEGTMLSVFGKLLIPGLYDNTPKSFPNMSSFEVLQDVSSDMKIGFATNETATGDRMTWIKPAWTKLFFLHKVMLHSFNDETSFYDGFVDRHYFFNFVNINAMFEENLDFEKMRHIMLSYGDTYTTEKTTEDLEVNNILTNLPFMNKSDNYISEYYIYTNNGNYISNESYIRKIGYYDVNVSNDFRENFVEYDLYPISDSLEPGKHTQNDNLKSLAQNMRGEWLGIDYNNAHDNYNYSWIHNDHNLKHIERITLRVTFKGVNLNLIRGQRYPVLIMLTTKHDINIRNTDIPEESRPVEDEKQLESRQIMIDEWLSGYYVVGSIRYTYDSEDTGDMFYTEATLLRMNWDKPEAIAKIEPEKTT